MQQSHLQAGTRSLPKVTSTISVPFSQDFILSNLSSLHFTFDLKLDVFRQFLPPCLASSTPRPTRACIRDHQALHWQFLRSSIAFVCDETHSSRQQRCYGQLNQSIESGLLTDHFIIHPFNIYGFLDVCYLYPAPLFHGYFLLGMLHD